MVVSGFALDQLQAFHVAPARAVGNVNFGSFSVDVKVGRPADSLNCLRGSTFFAESVDWAYHKSRGWLCESWWFAKGFMAFTSVCGCFPQIMIWGRSRICNHECLTFKVAFGSLCWTIDYRLNHCWILQQVLLRARAKWTKRHQEWHDMYSCQQEGMLLIKLCCSNQRCWQHGHHMSLHQYAFCWIVCDIYIYIHTIWLYNLLVSFSLKVLTHLEEHAIDPTAPRSPW